MAILLGDIVTFLALAGSPFLVSRSFRNWVVRSSRGPRFRLQIIIVVVLASLHITKNVRFWYSGVSTERYMAMPSSMMREPRTLLSAALTFCIVVSIVIKRLRYLILSHLARVWLLVRETVKKPKTDGAVTGIFIYPVKSLRAVSVPDCHLDTYGLEGDRRLMVVRPRPPPGRGSFEPGEATHRFVTQRTAPSLTQIIPCLSKSGQCVTLTTDVASDKNVDGVAIDITEKAIASYRRYRAGIWNDTVVVADVGDLAANFVRRVLANGEKAGSKFDDVRVAVMAPSFSRKITEKYVPHVAMHSGSVPSVALADGFPILIASESSLEELNRRLEEKGKTPVPMSRFRPNIVVRGTEPFEEDNWKSVKIGGTVFQVVKGCPRCKQSCTDQLTGEVSEEPLETLAEFRSLGGNKKDVYFCQNAVAQNVRGEVKVGDPVTVLTTGEPVFEAD